MQVSCLSQSLLHYHTWGLKGSRAGVKLAFNLFFPLTWVERRYFLNRETRHPIKSKMLFIVFFKVLNSLKKKPGWFFVQKGQLKLTWYIFKIYF
jgi:hypothetical protein